MGKEFILFDHRDAGHRHLGTSEGFSRLGGNLLHRHYGVSGSWVAAPPGACRSPTHHGHARCRRFTFSWILVIFVSGSTAGRGVIKPTSCVCVRFSSKPMRGGTFCVDVVSIGDETDTRSQIQGKNMNNTFFSLPKRSISLLIHVFPCSYFVNNTPNFDGFLYWNHVLRLGILSKPPSTRDLSSRRGLHVLSSFR